MTSKCWSEANLQSSGSSTWTSSEKLKYNACARAGLSALTSPLPFVEGIRLPNEHVHLTEVLPLKWEMLSAGTQHYMKDHVDLDPYQEIKNKPEVP